MAAGRSPGVPGAAVAVVGIGIWIVYAAVKDVPIVDGIRDLLAGRRPVGAGGPPYEPGRITFSGPGVPISASTTGTGSVGQPTGPIPQSETGLVPGTLIRVWRGLVPVITRLVNDARAAGLSINGWGWRSNVAQRALRLQHGYTSDSQPSGSGGRLPVAVPGRSRHEWGLAIDFTSGGSTIDRNDRLFAWLQANARNYGLVNLPSEPWHWSTDGR